MEIKIIFGVIASILAIFGYIPYLVQTWQSKVRPHAFSWFVWGFISGLVYLIQILKGAGSGAWATGVTSLLCLTIAAVALVKGEKKFSKADWVALVLALLSTILWLYTKNALIAVILLTIADTIGFIPTIIKARKFSAKENILPWVFSGIKYLVSLFALSTVSLETALFPVSVVVLDIIVILVIVFPKTGIRVRS